MTTDEALEKAAIVEDIGRQIPDEPLSIVEASLLVLAAEVRRYRAAVEALGPALICHDCRAGCGDTLERPEVLASLEPKP